MLLYKTYFFGIFANCGLDYYASEPFIICYIIITSFVTILSALQSYWSNQIFKHFFVGYVP